MLAVRGLTVLSLVVALGGCGSSTKGTGGGGSGDGAGDGNTADGGPNGGDGKPGDGQPGDGSDGAGDGADGNDGSDGKPGSSQELLGDIPPPLAASCGGKAKAGVKGALPSFEQKEISKQLGAAYLLPADLDGDTFPELLLTTLSEGFDALGGFPPLANGGAYVLARDGGKADGTLGAWTATKAFDKTAGIGFPNQSQRFDLDGDQIDDWIIGAGFLIKPTGKIVWMKGASDGPFGAPQEIAVPDGKCWYHIALGVDMDDDGDNDFVTSCHVGDTGNVNGPSRTEWFENQGDGKFASHSVGDGGGALISLHDLDADGDLDVIAPQFFGPEALVWFEQTEAKGAKWQKHLIDDTTGRGFIVKFADMNADGAVDLVYGNHNHQGASDAKNQTMGIYWFEIPGKDAIHELANWGAQKHTIFEGFKVDATGSADSAGAPGMINVGDIDGDCDYDITASGDGDHGLYVFVQQDDGFEQVVLSKADSNENSGEQHMLDLDADGDLDIAWAVFGQQTGFSSHVYAFLQK